MKKQQTYTVKLDYGVGIYRHLTLKEAAALILKDNCGGYEINRMKGGGFCLWRKKYPDRHLRETSVCSFARGRAAAEREIFQEVLKRAFDWDEKCSIETDEEYDSFQAQLAAEEEEWERRQAAEQAASLEESRP